MTPIFPSRLLSTLQRFAASAALLAASLCAHASIYTFVDEHGVRTFTDRREDPRAVLLWRDPNGPKGIAMDLREVLHKPPPGMLAKIQAAAQANHIEVAFLAAVISVESRYNPRARSAKGAMGLTQLMPATAQRYGVRNAYDVEQNLNGGAHYLADLLVLFNNDMHLAIAAFNAGEGAVTKYGNQIPPYAETQHYVPAVLAQMRMLRVEFSKT